MWRPLTSGLILALGLLMTAGADAATYTADVCVYGGTSGGVIAAVQAARLGKSVVIVNPAPHIGGMTASGLGQTDKSDTLSAAIGGTAREFYNRVGAAYGSSASVFDFEPHVASNVFDAMIAVPNLAVYSNKQLSLVTKSGTTITQITTTDGNIFQAKMFIDASYEGDLMSGAGVTSFIGREANSAYAESYDGVRTLADADPVHQFQLSIDPYVTTGIPASGLIPLVQSGSLATAGTADSKIQAYNYRLCMTNVAADKLPVLAPPGYDPAQYTLVARQIAAMTNNGITPTVDMFMHFGQLPNGKFDVNNTGPISTDFVGQNYTYPTADNGTRANIATAHKNYILGLIYFLGHESSLPSDLRNQMLSYGLSASEFTDNAGFPWQFYVREARRMVSDYTMREANVANNVWVTDSVALGNYTMDSHHAQRIVVGGVVKDEGNFDIAVTQPYSIAYHTIIPKAIECTNLFVPWSCSATHVAYASMRMEPVLMMLGQASGTAASLAIDYNTTAQNVSVIELQNQLRSDKQILNWGEDPASIVVTVDNSDPAGVATTGTWTASTAVGPYYASNYLHDGNTGKGSGSVTFTPNMKTAGSYEVYLRWNSPAGLRASNVPVDIHYSGSGSNTVTVDQTQNGGVWVPIGIYPFAAGTGGNVVIRNGGTTNYVVADAVRFIRRSTPHGGTAVAVPGTIQAGNYDDGGESVAFHDVTTGNTGGQYRTAAGEGVDIETCGEGGYDVTTIRQYEWMRYSVSVATAGTYSIGLRVASPQGDAHLHIEDENGANLTGDVTVPFTGGSQVWQTIVVPNVALSAGTHRLKVFSDAYNPFNLHTITIDSALFKTGFETADPQPTWTNAVDSSSNVSPYPYPGLTYLECLSTTQASHSGASAQMFSGSANGGASCNAYYKVFSANLPITSTTRMGYWLFPQQDNGRYTGIDLHCTDGTVLRNTAAVDYNGFAIAPSSGHGGSIALNQWTNIKCNIGQWLGGKTVDKIWIAFDRPNATGAYRGFIDDLIFTNGTLP